MIGFWIQTSLFPSSLETSVRLYPKGYRGKNHYPVELSAQARMKAALYRALLASGMKKSEPTRQVLRPESPDTALWQITPEKSA